MSYYNQREQAILEALPRQQIFHAKFLSDEEAVPYASGVELLLGDGDHKIRILSSEWITVEEVKPK